MNEKAQKREHFEKQITRTIPSQVPVHVTRKSYQAMLAHCATQTGKGLPIWACAKTGGRVKARMVQRAIYDSETGVFKEIAPVVELFCSVCHKPPVTRKLELILSDAIQTVSM